MSVRDLGTSSHKSASHKSASNKSGGSGIAVPIPELKKKTITLVGSIALLINNVTGGSMVVLPQTFQQAGWVLPVLALFGVAGLSCICGIMLIEAMTLVPGNNRFQKRLEYTNIAHIYFPRWLYWVAQIFYQLSILAQNISMIIQSVQVMDFTLVALTGYSCALPQFSPNFAFTCSYPGGYTTDGVSPFGDWYLISLGWFVTCAMVMPLGFIDLDDNDAVQKGGFAAVLAIVLVWCGLAISQPGGMSHVEHFGGQYDTLMGSVLFNFAIVYTIPSWVNEKRPSVPIVRALGFSLTTAALLFSVLGYCGGAGFAPPVNNQTLLNQIYALGSKISSVTFYLFPACVNLTTIPVNSIMQRYNLKEAGVCGAKMAAFLGVVSPWLIAIPLYTGNGYQTLVTWAGLVLNSSVNFIFPPIIYILAIRKYATGPGAIRTLWEEAELTNHSGVTRSSTSIARSKTRVSRGSAVAQANAALHHAESNARGQGLVVGQGEVEMPGMLQVIKPGTGVGIASDSARRRGGLLAGVDGEAFVAVRADDEVQGATMAPAPSPATDEHKVPLLALRPPLSIGGAGGGGGAGASSSSPFGHGGSARRESASARGGGGHVLQINVQPETARVPPVDAGSGSSADPDPDAVTSADVNQDNGTPSPATIAARHHPHHAHTSSISAAHAHAGHGQEQVAQGPPSPDTSSKPSPLQGPLGAALRTGGGGSISLVGPGEGGGGSNRGSGAKSLPPLKHRDSGEALLHNNNSNTPPEASTPSLRAPPPKFGLLVTDESHSSPSAKQLHKQHAGGGSASPPGMARMGTVEYAKPPVPPPYEEADGASPAAAGPPSADLASPSALGPDSPSAVAAPAPAPTAAAAAARPAGLSPPPPAARRKSFMQQLFTRASSTLAGLTGGGGGDATKAAPGAPNGAVASAHDTALGGGSPDFVDPAEYAERQAQAQAQAGGAPGETGGGGADTEGEDGEHDSDSDSQDGLGLTTMEARALEKEEQRRQRTLRRLRKARQRKEAAAANPDEVAKEAEVILPLTSFTPPPYRAQPGWFALWLVSLPWHALFFLTVPHSATTARFQKYWPVTLFSVVVWCTFISFFLVWSSSLFSETTGITPFVFGIFFIGFFIRWPNLLTEFYSFKNGTGDLNRIFSNSVWQICVCLPLPWMCKIIAQQGSPFVVYTGTQAILSLVLFLLSALLLVMFRSYDWLMIRPIGIAATFIAALIFAMVCLLDYNILLDLSTPTCNPVTGQ